MCHKNRVIVQCLWYHVKKSTVLKLIPESFHSNFEIFGFFLEKSITATTATPKRNEKDKRQRTSKKKSYIGGILCLVRVE